MIHYNVVYLILGFLGILKNPDAPLAYNSRCSVILKDGKIDCKDGGAGEKNCNISCHGKPMGVYTCVPDQGWQKKLPNCVSENKDYPLCSLSVDNGAVECADALFRKIFCNATCAGKFQGYYGCSIYLGWDKELPQCVSVLKDKPRCGLTVNKGAAFCEDEGQGKIACNVLCDGQPHGFYHCSQDLGWDRVLPHCVSTFEVDSRCSLLVKNGSVSCDDAKKGEITCNILCEGKDQGSYRCSKDLGWDKKLPKCVSDLKAPEKPSAAGPSCDATRCSKDCERWHVEGKCIRGVCKCGYKGPE